MARSQKQNDEKKPPAKKNADVKAFESSVPRKSSASSMSDSHVSVVSVSPSKDMRADSSPVAKKPNVALDATQNEDPPLKAPPILRLEDFGIKRETIITRDCKKVDSDTSKLTCVVVLKDGMLKHIVFRCIPKSGSASCWYEKLFFDAVRLKKPWADSLGLSYTIPWAINNIIQNNDRNFPIRMFCIDSQPTDFEPKMILALGKLICKNLNAENQFKSPRIEVADDFFWIHHNEDVVFSDITSTTECMSLIQKKCGLKTDNNFYMHNEEFIHCCFRRKELSAETADALGAPSDQIKHRCNFSVTLYQSEHKHNDDDEEVILM
jgi:hypothetical protein